MIIGIDEVGRGCWAGPLVAAAVGFEEHIEIPGLTDSKQLSAKKRRQLITVIQNTTSYIGVGWVWPKEINNLGLTESVRLAMQRAIDQVEIGDHEIIIDGSYNFLEHLPNTSPVIRADGTNQSVSAASVVAKVLRDEYMIEVSKKYPQYGFETNVGYGTVLHSKALKQHGVLSIHRINYKPIQKIINEKQT